MKRLTSKRSWNEAKNDLKNELGYSYIWTRLNEIENILGDEYNLNELKNYYDVTVYTILDLMSSNDCELAKKLFKEKLNKLKENGDDMKDTSNYEKKQKIMNSDIVKDDKTNTIIEDEDSLQNIFHVKNNNVKDNIKYQQKNRFCNLDKSCPFDDFYDDFLDDTIDTTIDVLLDSFFDYDFITDQIDCTEILIDICEYLITGVPYDVTKINKFDDKWRYYDFNKYVDELAIYLSDSGQGYDYCFDLPETIKSAFQRLQRYGAHCKIENGDIVGKIDLLEIMMYKRFLEKKLKVLKEWILLIQYEME